MSFIGLKMLRRRYSEEFKIEAVKQVTENAYSITDTDMSTLYHTQNKYI